MCVITCTAAALLYISITPNYPPTNAIMKLVLALFSVASVAALAPNPSQQGVNRRAVLKTGAAFPAFLVGAGKARAADKKAAPAAAPALAAPEPGFAQSPTGLQSKEISRPDGMERLATNVLKVRRAIEGRGWDEGSRWRRTAAQSCKMPSRRRRRSRQHARPGLGSAPSANRSEAGVGLAAAVLSAPPPDDPPC